MAFKAILALKNDDPAGFFDFSLLLLAAAAALAAVVFLFPTGYALLALAITAALFAWGRRHLYLLLAAAGPALAFGPAVYFEVRPNWIYEMTLAEAVLLVLGGVYVLEILAGRRAITSDRIGALLFLYLTVGALSFWQVSDYELYVAGLKVAAMSLLAYVLAREYIATARQREIFFLTLAATVAVMSAQIFYTIYQVGWSSRIFFERSTITTPVGAIALVSAILVFLLPLVLAHYFTSPPGGKARPFLLTSFVLGWTAVFLTLGKGAIASLLLGMAFLFVKFRPQRVAMGLYFLAFAVIGLLVMTPFFTGLVTRLANTFVDINSQFRLDEYRAAAKIISAHPVFGVGSGQQLLYYQETLNPYHRELANNFFLQAMLDYGVIGLGLALLLTAALYRRARLAAGRGGMAAGFTAALLVALANGLVEVTFFALPYAVIFWLTAGVYSGRFLKADKAKAKA